MLVWIPGYTVGPDPDDPTTIWEPPSYDTTKPPDDGLNHSVVHEIDFNALSQIIEISGGTLRELAGFARSQIQWSTVAESILHGLNTGLKVNILGVPDTTPAPTTVPANGSVPFTLKVQYFGTAGLPDSGDILISAVGVPDNKGNLNKQGAGSGEVFWGYLSPLVILTDTLPNAILGVSYSESLVAKGGNPPYTWGLYTTQNTGGLPPNLTLDPSSGRITGTPIQPGTWVFRVGILDTKQQTAAVNLSITVNQVIIVPPSPPPPPPGPPPPPPLGPPPTIGPPAPPVFVVEEAPGIEILIQPLIPDKCSGTVAGLGPMLINNFIIPRTPPGANIPITDGPWKDFFTTWYGFWTADQLSQMLVEVQMNMVEPISPGAQNNLYISALDVVVTKAAGPGLMNWLVNQKPEGRIKWMTTRGPTETGPHSGKWYDDDLLPYRPAADGTPSFMDTILGTAHKGGIDQASADNVLGKYEIFGWLDRDGDGTASAGDNPVTPSMAWLDTGIGVLDTTILIQNIGALKDPLNKYFQGFLIDNELIAVQNEQIDFETGLLNNVWRAVNETLAAFHDKGAVVFPVSYWELMYQIKVADATSGEFQGKAVGWDTAPATDDGTPGELLQHGPLDLRPFSGNYPIRWLLRLRVSDIFGLTSDSDMSTPHYTDRFVSTGPGARFGPEGDAYIPSKRVLYVVQSRDPKRPKILSSQ
jgi:hypothetical protein